MTRRRSARALENDVAIRAATISQILKVGVDQLTFRDVAEAADLSYGALYGRFEDVNELVVDLWATCLEMGAVSLFDGVARAVGSPTRQSVRSVMRRARHPSSEDIAMVNVLWNSRRRVAVREEVEPFLQEYFGVKSPHSPHVARSRITFTYFFVLLAMFGVYQGSLDKEDLDFFESVLHHALSVPREDVAPLALREPVGRVETNSVEDMRSRLARHTFHAVAVSGCSGATISRIARRASVSPGGIYKMYPSKADLIVAAIRTHLNGATLTAATLSNVLEPGNLAQLLYFAASHDNEPQRDFTLEIIMVSTYEPQLRKAARDKIEFIESLVPLIEGLDVSETEKLSHTIRLLVCCVMGVNLLTSLTKVTSEFDFNDVAEPLRRSLLISLDSAWPALKSQVEVIVNSSGVRADRRRC